jgi:hypothetical protein
MYIVERGTACCVLDYSSQRARAPRVDDAADVVFLALTVLE